MAIEFLLLIVSKHIATSGALKVVQQILSQEAPLNHFKQLYIRVWTLKLHKRLLTNSTSKKWKYNTDFSKSWTFHIFRLLQCYFS